MDGWKDREDTFICHTANVNFICKAGKGICKLDRGSEVVRQWGSVVAGEAALIEQLRNMLKNIFMQESKLCDGMLSLAFGVKLVKLDHTQRLDTEASGMAIFDQPTNQ